jgi:hypothetical protein
MIGQIITDKDGKPLDSNGKSLTASQYQPSEEIKKLFKRVQQDYQVAYMLQHRGFDEFDGVSLLERARLDQQTFGAFVGAEYVPTSKKWRWKGRKNTARNKLLGICAHMIAGMLYPYVYSKNNQDEEDKMAERVMRILIEDHLRKAGYETKFLYMILSALVNPAVFVETEYVQAMQRVKTKTKDGKFKIIEAVDELLSGLNLNIVPIDELMLADFYTSDIQRQPYIIRVRRISYDNARKMYAGKYYVNNIDQFDFVKAGMTRCVLAGQENQTLFDIEWTEADQDFVQELTVYYRDEDFQCRWIGGVFLGESENVYNSNPFEHRRMTCVDGEWISVPIYPFAKSGFEPIDPTGRFAYYKSGAFKEYWDDMGSNLMDRLLMDGTQLDVMKPMFYSGVAKVDSNVMVPGASVAMPTGATATPYMLGPNLAAAITAMKEREAGLSESTQDKIMSGGADKGVTAYATRQAEQNARIVLGMFGVLTADLVVQIGDLTKDIVIAYSTVGELDSSVPEALKMKYRNFLIKGKDKGKNVTNKIVFDSGMMGRNISKDDKSKREWDLYHKSGDTAEARESSDQRLYMVNPYQFARMSHNTYIDPDQIVRKSTGLDEQRKVLAFNMLTDPRVAPYTDQEAVIHDFAIEPFAGDDPDRYKRKGDPSDMLNEMMGGVQGTGPVKSPIDPMSQNLPAALPMQP